MLTSLYKIDGFVAEKIINFQFLSQRVPACADAEHVADLLYADRDAYSCDGVHAVHTQDASRGIHRDLGSHNVQKATDVLRTRPGHILSR
jgi:hypothetical protein